MNARARSRGVDDGRVFPRVALCDVFPGPDEFRAEKETDWRGWLMISCAIGNGAKRAGIENVTFYV